MCPNPFSSEAETVETCNTKRYHLTTQIQPHWVVLVVDPRFWQITHSTANVSVLFTGDVTEVVGARLSALLTEESVSRLQTAAHALRDGVPYDRTFVADVATLAGPRADAVLSESGPRLILELEPRTARENHNIELETTFYRWTSIISDHSKGRDDLAALTCHALHELTGFHRTYFCQFDDEGNGSVLAEHVTGPLPSLIGHRFPKTDIPDQMRAIYIKNRFRAICDASAHPTELTSGNARLPEVFDLTMAVSRQPGETHVEYMRNMGVAASMSFSIVVDGRLVGIFGGHHAEPRLVDYRRLLMCQQVVGQYLSRDAFVAIKEHQDAYESRVSTVQEAIQGFAEAKHDWSGLNKRHFKEWMRLLDADGLVCRYHGTYFGHRGGGEEVWPHLGAHLDTVLVPGQVYSTDTLGTPPPFGLGEKEGVCGILAIPLIEQSRDETGGRVQNWVAWVRQERKYHEKWSGNPAEAVQVDRSGRVGPRKSFATWIRQVQGHAVPWRPHELQLADMFRRLMDQELTIYATLVSQKAAEEANAAKTQFLANMSHELRTPLHTIMGFSDLVLEKLDTMSKEKQRSFMELIGKSGERLLGLIDDLLQLSKLEAGMLRFEFAQANIVEVIRRSMMEIKDLDRCEVRLEMCAEQTEVTIDQDRIIQVLINVLGNAAKFTPPGKLIVVRTKEMQRPGKNRCLLLEVADQGVGIPTGELEHIFDKFVQSSTTTTGAGGTGLGLSISREIVQAHDGHIWAEHNTYGGTSVFIALPFDRNTSGSHTEETHASTHTDN